MFSFQAVLCLQFMHIIVTASLSWKQGICRFTGSVHHGHVLFSYTQKNISVVPWIYEGTKIFQRAASGPLDTHRCFCTMRECRETGVPFTSWDLPKKKTTGPFHSQSLPRPPGVGDITPLLDLAIKSGEWKKYIWFFFRNPPEFLFPLFVLPTFYSQWVMGKTFLIYIVSLPKFCVILYVLTQKLKK